MTHENAIWMPNFNYLTYLVPQKTSLSPLNFYLTFVVRNSENIKNSGNKNKEIISLQHPFLQFPTLALSYEKHVNFVGNLHFDLQVSCFSFACFCTYILDSGFIDSVMWHVQFLPKKRDLFNFRSLFLCSLKEQIQ